MSDENGPGADTVGRRAVQVLSIAILVLLGGGFALVFLSEFAFWWVPRARDSLMMALLPAALVLAVAALLPRTRPMLLGALLGPALLVGNLASAVGEGAPLRYALSVLALVAGGALAYAKGGRTSRSAKRYLAGLAAGTLAAALLLLVGSMLVFSTF